MFSNIDIDPRETLKLAETESILWAEAQLLNINRATQPVEVRNLQSIPLRWCFTYGSWKDKEPYSGQGWYIILEGFDGLMGARNVRAAFSRLHAEVDALIWAMECMRNFHQFQVTLATDCSKLVRWFRNQKNDQRLKCIWKTLRF